MFRNALTASVLLLLVSCGASEPSARPTQTPVSEAAPDPASTASPAPTSTSVLNNTVRGVCPDSREHAGLAYTFDPSQISTFEAWDEFCGLAKARPTAVSEVSATCPESRERAGLRFQYDPAEMAREEALIREEMGEDMFERYIGEGGVADFLHCGELVTTTPERVPESAWTVDRGRDGVDRPYTDTILHDYFGLRENPKLAVWCDEGELLVAISVGTGRIIPTNGPFVELGYQFGNWGEAEASGPYFEQDWLGDNRTGAYAGLPPGSQSEFVRALRRYEQVSFAILSAGDGINTVHFDLTGVDRDVGPVLQECGY